MHRPLFVYFRTTADFASQNLAYDLNNRQAVLGRPFVKRLALSYRTVVLSVCPGSNVGVLWPNGWMD